MYENIFFDRKKRMREEKLSISSKMEDMRLVERFIEDICNKNQISNSYFASIMMAVSEAVKNAIIHGNCNDENKKVDITFEFCKMGGISFIVSDQGEGFDYEAMSNNFGDEISEKQGLFLIKHLSDMTIFRNKGAEIEMDFVIAGISPIRTQERINAMMQYSEKIHFVKLM